MNTAHMPPKKTLYLYLDEGGNLDFSKKGTPYFVLTTIACNGVPAWGNKLNELRAELNSTGLNLPYFHASEDKQKIRDRVFEIICAHQKSFLIDSLIVEKAKTGPKLQEEVQFYSRMIGYLLKWRIANLNPFSIGKVQIITDSLPATRQRRKSIEKAIKEEMAKPNNLTKAVGMLPYEMAHDASRNHPGLQIADYCNWAIYRKWTLGDCRSYDLIKSQIKSEFDIFKTGTIHYY
jgi:hypothetical protein